jgi:hypothetical protein
MYCKEQCLGPPAPSNSSSVPVPEEFKINDNDFFSHLADELIFKIFAYLSATQLAKCAGISRTWKRVASDATLWNALDLRKISPSLKVFDESDWVTYVDLPSFGLTTKDAPRLDKRKAIPVLKRCLSFPVEGDKGVTLLTIPKGLTLNKLVKLAESPIKGNTTKFRYIWNCISNKFGDIEVDKTYRIVITNNVLKVITNNVLKWNLFPSNRETLLKRIGCEMPKLLEAAVLLVVTFMSSGERLYNDKPKTYTRCSEVACFQLIIGNFSQDGILVLSSISDRIGNGVAGVLRDF